MLTLEHSGWMYLVKSLSIPLIILLINAASAEYIEEDNLASKEENNLTFKLDQKISGNGYFAAYMYVLMPDALGISGRLFNGVESAARSHGSGTIEIDAQVYAESFYKNESYENACCDEEEPYEELEDADSIINLKGNSSIVYGLRAMPIGSQYYSNHPVIFNSLLKDEVYIKNRDNLNSMYFGVDKAHALKDTLDIQANYSSTIMKVDEDVTAGHAHIGVLQLTDGLDLTMKDWKKPVIELSENYIGTFHLVKNASLFKSSEQLEKEETWLPCCLGGYEDMMYYDLKGFGKSTKEIFDYHFLSMPI